MRILLLVLCVTTSLCAKQARPLYQPPELEEMRIDLEDLKHVLKTLQVDVNLIDERSKKQPGTLSLTLAALEKKINQLEKTLDKALEDVRALHSLSSEIALKLTSLEQTTAQHEKRFDDVSRLKGTLTSLTKAIGKESSTAATYRVKAGDSLEKIARVQGISVATLKKINNLQTDRIVIGQELKLRDE